MRYVEAQVMAPAIGGPPDAEPGGGEPAAMFAGATLERLFADLERDIRGADVLRIRETAWLTPGDLRQRVEALVRQFRERGGTVEFEPAARCGVRTGGAHEERSG